MSKIFKPLYYLSVLLIGTVFLFLAFSVLPLGNNTHIYTVQTGSMEPAISSGDIIIVRTQNDYEKGDIVTFRPLSGGDGTPVTHRIYEKQVNEEGAVEFLTKGDANASPDMDPVAGDRVIGSVSFSVPFVGRIIDFAKTPLGFVLMLVLPMGIMIFDEARSIARNLKKIRVNNNNYEK